MPTPPRGHPPTLAPPAPDGGAPVPADGAPPGAPLPLVHAVTTPEVLLAGDFVARATAVLRALGARGAVHLRGPGVPARRLLALAEALAPVQAETGGWVIVNERVDVALAGGCRGVQLTSRALTVADARRVAPQLPVGASVHAVAEAREAARSGAAWVVAGHVYPTASHPGEAGRGAGFLREVAAAVALPVVAIGGVTPEQVATLCAAGAYGVAAIRGIWGASDADRAATHYLASYDAYATDQRYDRPDGERRAARGA